MGELTAPWAERLDAVLDEAARLGFLGGGPAAVHRDHALGFVAVVARTEGHVVDLGTGGGVPGLVLAAALAPRTVVCVERRARRAAFLRMATVRLGLANAVVEASDVAALIAGDHWTGAGAVTARSFGPPAVTMKAGSALLAPGGLLVVSEPPADEDRWAAAALHGLELAERTMGWPRLAVLRLRPAT